MKQFPAPWNLTGKGYIFILKNKKKQKIEDIHIPDILKSKFCGGFGMLMLVEYLESNVGPYNEILYIPGKFFINGKKKYSITKIFVSSEASVEWGRKNWAIPKEFAEIDFKSLSKNTEEISVKTNGNEFFKTELKKIPIFFPVHTAFFPVPLAQIAGDEIFYTKFTGYGIGYFIKTKRLEILNEYFPNVSINDIIACIKIEKFKITFPVADVKTGII